MPKILVSATLAAGACVDQPTCARQFVRVSSGGDHAYRDQHAGFISGGVDASLLRAVEADEGQLNPVQKLVADLNSGNVSDDGPELSESWQFPDQFIGCEVDPPDLQRTLPHGLHNGPADRLEPTAHHLDFAPGICIRIRIRNSNSALARLFQNERAVGPAPFANLSRATKRATRQPRAVSSHHVTAQVFSCLLFVIFFHHVLQVLSFLFLFRFPFSRSIMLKFS
jgi:hypothetical protein